MFSKMVQELREEEKGMNENNRFGGIRAPPFEFLNKVFFESGLKLLISEISKR